MKTRLTLLLFITMALLNSCDSDTTCGDDVYKGNLTDDLMIINNADTTNIVIEQIYFFNYSPDSIIYSYKVTEDSSDLIKLNLFVSYESYTKIADINKEINLYADTVFVWYSIIEKYSNTLMKNNSIVEIECSPFQERSRIDSIHVEVGKNKLVKIKSKYLSL